VRIEFESAPQFRLGRSYRPLEIKARPGSRDWKRHAANSFTDLSSASMASGKLIGLQVFDAQQAVTYAPVSAELGQRFLAVA